MAIGDWAGLVAATNNLIENQTFEAHQAHFLSGEEVCILWNPCRTEAEDRSSVPITICPRRYTPRAFLGMCLVLHRAEDNQFVGCTPFNDRGQVILRNLPRGSYRLKIRVPTSVELTGKL